MSTGFNTIDHLAESDCIVVIPIISMRSYKTGRYDLLKDGNIQYHLAWLDYIHSLNSKVRLVMCLPSDINMIEGYEYFESYTQVNYPFIEYVGCLNIGSNAAATRDVIYSSNIKQALTALGITTPTVVLDFENFESFDLQASRIVYNMNTDPKATINVNATTETEIMTVVPRIAAELSQSTNCRVSLNTHSVCGRVLRNESQRVTDRTVSWFIKTASSKIEQAFILNPQDPAIWFFPMRASDPCYNVESVIETAMSNNISMVVTDPNHTFKDYAAKYGFTNYTISENIRNSKELYYYILSKQPNIPYKEDPERMLHPGYMEMKYFNVNFV